MNVKIGSVDAQFLFWKYLLWIFGIVSLQCTDLVTVESAARSAIDLVTVELAALSTTDLVAVEPAAPTATDLVTVV
jgi:hypothetical protein